MLQDFEISGIGILKFIPEIKSKFSKEPIERKEFYLYYEFNFIEDFPPDIRSQEVVGLILRQLIPLHYKLDLALRTGTVVDSTVRLSSIGKGSGMWFLKAFFYIEM